jgi:hypothetical protein
MVKRIMENRKKEANFDHNLYPELSIELDPTEKNWSNGSHQDLSEIEKRVVIKNGSQPIYDCRVILEDLAYHFGNEWTEPPNGYEKKALQWADESDALEGRIGIAANKSTKLVIARLFRYPNPYFGITYCDGSYGKTHHFIGAYKLRLRLEGKIRERSNVHVIVPSFFEIYLNYVGALELTIDEIVRTNIS